MTYIDATPTERNTHYSKAVGGQLLSRGKDVSLWKRKSFATSDMSKQYTIPEILSAEIEALRTIPRDNDYEAAIRLILEHVHQGGGRLITSGMGKA